MFTYPLVQFNTATKHLNGGSVMDINDYLIYESTRTARRDSETEKEKYVNKEKQSLNNKSLLKWFSLSKGCTN